MGHGDFKPSNIMLRERQPSSNVERQNDGRSHVKNIAEQLERGDLTVTFIDFELGGPNYRGFDIFKLFRRGQIKNNGGEPESMSHENLRAFVASYLEAIEKKDASAETGRAQKHAKKTNFEECQNNKANGENLTFDQKAATLACIASGATPDTDSPGSFDRRLEALLAEVYIFEPLTWLEAAVFFLFAIQEDTKNMDTWSELAVHRWDNYEKSKSSIQVNSEALLRASGP